MRCRKTPIAILNAVQMLDQQISPTRQFAEKSGDFPMRLCIDAPALWRAAHMLLLVFRV